MKYLKLFEQFTEDENIEIPIIKTDKEDASDLDVMSESIFRAINRKNSSLWRTFFGKASKFELPKLYKNIDDIISNMNGKYSKKDFIISDYKKNELNHIFTVHIRNNDESRKYIEDLNKPKIEPIYDDVIKKHIDDISIIKTKNVEMDGIPYIPYNFEVAYVFASQENIDYLKTNNIKYNIIPMNKINIEDILKFIIDKKINPKYGTTLISDLGYIKKEYQLQFFNLPYSFDIEYLDNIKNDIKKLLNKINSELNIELVFETKPILSNDTMDRNIKNKLNGVENSEEQKYKNVYFYIKNDKQGKTNIDDDYMALVWIDKENKNMPVIMNKKTL